MRILGVVSSSSREVPNAPTIGTATDVGTGRAYNNGAATVTFTAPTWTGGLPITSYTVTSSPGGFTATGAASPLTVTGLQSGVAYTFTVRATNSVGQSAASAASNSITATTVPQAPTIGTATAGNASATVAFTAGANGGKAISTFTSTSSPAAGSGSSATSPITHTGLTNGTAYTFTVRATNANGTSTASAASNSVTPVVPTSFDSIATITPSGSTSTITFSSIPSGYKHLQIRLIQKYTSTPTSLLPFSYSVRMNGDTGTNYSYHYLNGNGSSAAAGGLDTQNQILFENSAIRSATAQANMFAAGIIDIADYSSTSKNKTLRAFTGVNQNSSVAGENYVNLISGAWYNTSAVSSITIFSANTLFFTNTSSFALYGIKG